MAGPVIDNKIGFFHEFLLKHYLLRACYLGFDWSACRDNFDFKKCIHFHNGGNGLAGQFWQMVSAL